LHSSRRSRHARESGIITYNAPGIGIPLGAAFDGLSSTNGRALPELMRSFRAME